MDTGFLFWGAEIKDDSCIVYELLKATQFCALNGEFCGTSVISQ